MDKNNKDEYEKMTKAEQLLYIAKHLNKTEQDNPLFKALLKAFQDKEFNESASNLFEKFWNVEAKNVNPLTEIPESKMRLYGFSGAFNSAYFDTEKELIEWLKNHNTNFGNICFIDYLGNVAGRSDVIRKTYMNGESRLYSVCDKDGYGIYNSKRSIDNGEYIWEYNYGSISDMYSAFRDRGISFENDIYGEIDKKYQNILKLCREKNFNINK